MKYIFPERRKKKKKRTRWRKIRRKREAMCEFRNFNLNSFVGLRKI